MPAGGHGRPRPGAPSRTSPPPPPGPPPAAGRVQPAPRPGGPAPRSATHASHGRRCWRRGRPRGGHGRPCGSVPPAGGRGERRSLPREPPPPRCRPAPPGLPRPAVAPEPSHGPARPPQFRAQALPAGSSAGSGGIPALRHRKSARSRPSARGRRSCPPAVVRGRVGAAGHPRGRNRPRPCRRAGAGGREVR